MKNLHENVPTAADKAYNKDLLAVKASGDGDRDSYGSSVFSHAAGSDNESKAKKQDPGTGTIKRTGIYKEM